MSNQQSSTPSSSSNLHQHSSHRILSSWVSLRRRLSSSTQQIDTDGTSFAKTSRHTKQQRRARRRTSESTLSISTRSSYGSVDEHDDSQQIQCIPTEVQMTTTTRRPSYVPCQQQEEVVPTTTDGHVSELQYTYIHDSITYEGIYTGQVKCSKPHGIGTWRYQSGNGSVILSIDGEWFCGFSISGEKTHELVPQKHSLMPLPSILRRSTKHNQEKEVYNKSVHFKREATLVAFRSLPCLLEGDREDSSSASSIGDGDESIASIDSIEGVYEEFILKTATPPAA